MTDVKIFKRGIAGFLKLELQIIKNLIGILIKNFIKYLIKNII